MGRCLNISYGMILVLKMLRLKRIVLLLFILIRPRLLVRWVRILLVLEKLLKNRSEKFLVCILCL